MDGNEIKGTSRVPKGGDASPPGHFGSSSLAEVVAVKTLVPSQVPTDEAAVRGAGDRACPEVVGVSRWIAKNVTDTHSDPVHKLHAITLHGPIQSLILMPQDNWTVL